MINFLAKQWEIGKIIRKDEIYFAQIYNLQLANALKYAKLSAIWEKKLCKIIRNVWQNLRIFFLISKKWQLEFRIDFSRKSSANWFESLRLFGGISLRNNDTWKIEWKLEFAASQSASSFLCFHVRLRFNSNEARARLSHADCFRYSSRTPLSLSLSLSLSRKKKRTLLSESRDCYDWNCA